MTATSTPRLRASLARSTLVKMGVGVAGIIALTTFFSYRHMVRSLRAEALGYLEKYVSERAQREQALFLLAEDNHALLKRALEERIRALRQEDPNPRFESLFTRMPDGTIRSRPERFDGRRMPGVFVSSGTPLDEELRRRLLATYDVLHQYGPAFHTRFTNTYVTLPEKLLAIYWPESPAWVQEAQTDSPVTSLELFTISLPEHNPSRRTAWCGIFADTVIGSWMVSVSTPLDLDGRHVATFSHDILLKDLMGRTLNERLPGSYNMIFRDDGLLIAHPELMKEDAVGTYNIREADSRLESGELLKRIFERVRNRRPEQTVLEEGDVFLAVARLRGPEWNFVTVLPRSEVTRPAALAARYVLVLGGLALLMVLGIMYGVMRGQITRPLQGFTRAADQVANGDFKVQMDTSREDELGHLARAFQVMADGVQRREEALRQANDELEQRVRERTRELKEIHRRLVDSARQAGMAEIATNVLHTVGNVLNSVQTSVLMAKERMDAMKLDRVGKLGELLEAHQADLPTFLAQDERGHIIPAFLSRLGRSLEEERRRLHEALEEVRRHTEHISAIVNFQPYVAKVPRSLEPVALGELIEEVLRLDSAALSRHEVKVERHLAELPPVLTEKHTVLRILMNLISNARYALEANSPGERRLTLRLEPLAGGRALLEVSDNGIGIPSELLTRIFEAGFTTRAEGHGFGLHSSAIAAQELGGSLRAYSDGEGLGATFRLELPCQPHSAPA
ncbi:ATP-binding protein [Hyalangium gracile]|uniref:ATP-binding protein n=1 Tax=Hyalangium gracile TaxID=394092 RepID=UPI001CCC2F85|nr:ATP-binding protein [Hyalangium gracile]